MRFTKRFDITPSGGQMRKIRRKNAKEFKLKLP